MMDIKTRMYYFRNCGPVYEFYFLVGSPVMIFPRVFGSLGDALRQLQPAAMERIA